ncbi:LytR cell envelope-related transcriptional attenuator [Nocardioides terrae]|uniref:LytR cell envelope-related transcriptional attenuator n=1 Tax=Nocardioides terrae TaxID=574651 RepID=A0A1I1N6Z7_9ACTN|nr:LytR C-terminal domain-containing protein [Nocardioides terrae]SFC89510.1 LytR cell envelope-related transcriptional attenuator [Nocardioides terrae]
MVRRDQRGVVLPSPVMMLSIVAVVMAGVAFFATRGDEPAEREIANVAQPSAAATPAATAPAPAPTRTPKPIVRKKVMVEVFNNTATKGLAAEVGDQVAHVGWQVVGADNWYGSVPSTTVYYPAKLKREGKQLALDLGIKRTAKAIDPMKLDRLTIILTGPLH